MNIPFLKYTLTLGLLALTAPVFAQDEKDDTVKGAITEEIEVVRPYKPVLADAVKIRRNPDLTNERPFKPVLTYVILDKKLELNTDIKQLQAQKLADEQLTLLSNNYVKVGAGNLNTGLGEVYLNTGKDEALQAGVYLKHLSQQGELDKQQFSNQQLSVFGRSIGDEITLAGRVNYDRRATYYYGFNPTFEALNTDPDRQRYNFIELDGELMNNYTEDTDRFSYALKANAYFFNNITNGRENSALLSGYFNKAFNKFNFGVGASADFTKTKDLDYDIGNNILRANPYVKFQGNGFLLNVGLNVVQEFGTNSRLNVLPAVSAEIPIASDYAAIFAGINGDVIKTTLKNLAFENPYINQNASIRNTVEKMNIYGGVKGNAGAGFGFRLMAYYKNVEDLQLYVNDSIQVSRFNVVYDNGLSDVVGFEGELNIKTSDIFDLTGKIEAITYSLATEKEAWFKPDFRLSANTRARVNRSLTFDAEVVFNGETSAKTYNFTPLPEQQTTTVGSFVDLSAGAEYRFRDKVGLYVRANNLFGNNYQRYLYYPKLGLQILGGFNYSF